MNLRRLAAVAALFALPVVATIVLGGAEGFDGQSMRQQLGFPLTGGIRRADTVGVVSSYDASGNQYVAEAFPAFDQNGVALSLVNATLSIGAADSNAIPVDTHKFRLGMLLIKAHLAGSGTVDTTCVARVAVQIRTHLNGQTDSSSTFPIYYYGNTPALNATTFAPDTSLEGHLYSGTPITGIAATPGANTAWSGEYTFHISAKRNARGNSIGMSNGSTFYYPNGIAVPLVSLFGREVWSPFTSVRVRVMSFQKGSASLTGGQVVITVHLIGTPL